MINFSGWFISGTSVFHPGFPRHLFGLHHEVFHALLYIDET